MPRVTGQITTTAPTDVYPTHDSVLGLGGLMSVADHTARNAITLERRKEGMIVYTQSDASYWVLNPPLWIFDDTDWIALGTVSVPDATASVKGKLRLTADLGGTADNPLVKRTTRFIIAPYGDTRPADYTCHDATNNDVEINAAFVAANALPGGGEVDLLDGSFVVSNPIIPLNHITFRGQGMFLTKTGVPALGTRHIMNFAGFYSRDNPLTDFQCYDMEFDDTNLDPNVGQKAINGQNYQNCNFERLYIHHSTATGLGIDYPTNSVISGCIVTDCGFDNKHVITAASWAANVFTYTTADPHGYTVDVKATGTLTSSGGIADGDTVDLDNLIYTFKTTLTGASFEVFINGSDANALANLQKALGLTGVAGTDYGLGTVRHPSVDTSTLTSTTLDLIAHSYGAAGNNIVTSATGTALSFGSVKLTGGATGSKIVITGMTPIGYTGLYTVTSVPTATTFTVSLANNTGNLNFSTDPGPATVFGQSSNQAIGHNGIGIGTNDNYTESLLCTDNICINNLNNNILMENDGKPPNYSTQYNSSYIVARNISINGGEAGYRNTGTLNVQFNDNYDYGSAIGGVVNAVFNVIAVTAASWSAGVATITTQSVHNYSVGTKVLLQNIIPSTWNNYYTVLSIIDTHNFTIGITSDPGTALYFGTTRIITRYVDGTSFNDCVFSNNRDQGILNGGQSDGVFFKNCTVKYCYNYGIQTSSAHGQITGCKVFGCGRAGIFVGSATAQPIDAVMLATNEVYNNGWRIASPGVLISGAVTNVNAPLTNVHITGLHAYDDQAVKTQTYGVQITGNPSNVFISDSDLLGNLTGPISYPTANNTIYIDNIGGVNPRGKNDLGNISGTVTFDSSVASYFTGTLTGPTTAVMPANAVEGARMTWVLQQDSTGSRTLTLPSNAKAAQGGLTLSKTASAIDTITWTYSIVSSKWIEESRALADVQATVQVSRVNTLSAVSAVYTPNVSTTDLALIVNPGANFTIANPTGTPTDGQKFQIRVTSNATGRVPTWGSMYVANPGWTLPTTALPNNSVITFSFEYDAAAAAFRLYVTDYPDLTLMDLASSQTVGGVKTFTSAPVVPSSSFPESAVTNLTTDLTSKAAKGANADITSLSGLTTPLSVAQGGTGAGTLTGLVKGNGTTAMSVAASGTDYAPATSGSGILKGNSSGGFSTATADTDYTTPTGTETFTNKDVKSATNTFAAVTSIASSSTPTPTGDSRQNELYVTAQAASATFGAPSGTPTNGNKLLMRVKDNGTAQTLAWNAIYVNSGTASLPATTVIGKTHFIAFIYDSTAVAWVCLASDPVGY